MKTKTPFYELAEKIGNEATDVTHLESLWLDGVCFRRIRGSKKKKHRLLYETFPGIMDLLIPDRYDKLFIMERYGSFENTLNVRVIALLFADLLWQDEMKGGGK